MENLIFVTSSRQKFLEAEKVLGRRLVQRELDLPEIQAIELERVIETKAQFAYEAVGRVPVIIEDTGLFIDCWKGLPGALIRWFVETVSPEGIVSMMNSFQDRRAYAKSVVALYDGGLKVYSGEIKGCIAHVPRGSKGFGWDSIFIPDGETKTFAEMEPNEKDRYSMRRMAIEKLVQSI